MELPPVEEIRKDVSKWRKYVDELTKLVEEEHRRKSYIERIHDTYVHVNLSPDRKFDETKVVITRDHEGTETCEYNHDGLYQLFVCTVHPHEKAWRVVVRNLVVLDGKTLIDD